MTNRQEWLFSYRAFEVAEAAQKLVDFHEQRQQEWLVEQGKAEILLREKGIELRTHAISGGERMEAHLDATLGARLSECKGKVQEHASAARDFAAYVRACGKDPDKHLDLTVGDVAYFEL